MKKKVLSLLLCVTMAASLFAGCKSAVESEEEDSAAEESADDEAEKGEKETAGIPKDEIKVGFVHVSDASDMGYTYNHDLGTKAMQEALGLSDDQIVNKMNVPEGAECDTAL